MEGDEEASPERNKRKRLNLTDDMGRNGADGDAATFGVDEEEAKEEEKLSSVLNKRKRQYLPLLPLKRRRTLRQQEDEEVVHEWERESNKRKRLHLPVDLDMQVKRPRITPLPCDTENDSETLPELERGLYTIDEKDEDEELESDEEVE